MVHPGRDNETMQKVFLSVAAILWHVFMPRFGYCDARDVAGHLLYVVSHANVWHLSCNLFCLWMMKGRLYAWEAFVISVACSWIPSMPGVFGNAGETMGMSGMLFGIAGVKWGACRRGNANNVKQRMVREFCRKVLPFVLAGAFVPGINWSLHLYCLTGGMALGACIGEGESKGDRADGRDRANKDERTGKTVKYD